MIILLRILLFHFTAHERTVFLYKKKANFEMLGRKILSVNREFLSACTVEETFTSTFLKLVKSCIPFRKVLTHPDDKPRFNSK